MTSGKGTVSTNVADYAKKDLQVAFANASVTTSVLLELIANRKTVLGALHWHADHEKMGMTEGELQQAHAVLDAKRLMLVNRTVVRSLHDAVFPNASETPATIKLRSILKTPEVTKILQGEKLTTESQWAENPWLIPAVLMYGRLAYKFEGMTDMINAPCIPLAHIRLLLPRAACNTLQSHFDQHACIARTRSAYDWHCGIGSAVQGF